MLTPDILLQILPKLKRTWYVFLALGAGLLMFAIAIGFVVDWERFSTEAGMISLMGAVTGLMMFGMSFMVPKLIGSTRDQVAAQLIKEAGGGEITDLRIYDSLADNLWWDRILAGMILESGIFLNFLTFFVEPNSVALAVILIGAVIYLFRFPFIFRQKMRLARSHRDMRAELALIRVS